ncbi:uncharacterized protein LOC118435444 [Folsomia candida]|nr:uncharacterized protein LOC118435444 [Folsomia candida]
MAAKTLLQLLQYDYAESNTNVEIKVKKSNGIRYREGVTTDADHEPCEVLTYNWAQRIGEPYKKHQVTIFNPHFLAFRYGRRFYEPEKEFGVFPTSLALKTMLHKFLDEIGTLRNAPFWDFPQFIRQRLMHQKLIRYEKFSEAQLFFLISFRELCRSRVSDELLDIYHYHATENIAGLMQMEEFASTWRCSPNSMMNPALKCFSR